MPCCITGPAFVKGGARCNKELTENEMFAATFATGAGGCRGPLALQTMHWEVQMGLTGLFTAHFADEKTEVQRDQVACSVSYS